MTAKDTAMLIEQNREVLELCGLRIREERGMTVFPTSFSDGVIVGASWYVGNADSDPQIAEDWLELKLRQ